VDSINYYVYNIVRLISTVSDVPTRSDKAVPSNGDVASDVAAANFIAPTFDLPEDLPDNHQGKMIFCSGHSYRDHTHY